MFMFVFYYLFKAAPSGTGYKMCINMADLFRFWQCRTGFIVVCLGGKDDKLSFPPHQPQSNEQTSVKMTPVKLVLYNFAILYASESSDAMLSTNFWSM